MNDHDNWLTYRAGRALGTGSTGRRWATLLR
eukprot:COSAG03_NODE_16908_length_388_cov_2197.256055_1_plen_30_part_10